MRDDIELIPDVEVLDDELLGVEASHDLDRLQILMDVSATGTSGYQAADWLREHKQIDVGMSDHRRMLATMSFADDKATAERLLDALWAWREGGQRFRPACRRSGCRRRKRSNWRASDYPATRSSDRSRRCPPTKASGRIAAEQITPYPPGIPAVVPGERLNDAVIDYLRSGLDAGMNVPDAADATLETFRVVVT